MEWRKVVAEFYGTLLITFAFCATRADPFATGASLFVAYISTALISEGHFNPVVTLSFIMTRIMRR
jgi:glycerol uptake facilitator-like aquaporin